MILKFILFICTLLSVSFMHAQEDSDSEEELLLKKKERCSNDKNQKVKTKRQEIQPSLSHVKLNSVPQNFVPSQTLSPSDNSLEIFPHFTKQITLPVGQVAKFFGSFLHTKVSQDKKEFVTANLIRIGSQEDLERFLQFAKSGNFSKVDNFFIRISEKFNDDISKALKRLLLAIPLEQLVYLKSITVPLLQNDKYEAILSTLPGMVTKYLPINRQFIFDFKAELVRLEHESNTSNDTLVVPSKKHWKAFLSTLAIVSLEGLERVTARQDIHSQMLSYSNIKKIVLGNLDVNLIPLLAHIKLGSFPALQSIDVFYPLSQNFFKCREWDSMEMLGLQLFSYEKNYSIENGNRFFRIMIKKR